MTEKLAFIGGFTVFIIVGFLVLGTIYMILSLIKSIIDNIKRKNQYKHRFDKPPTAKCYCKDCQNWKGIEYSEIAYCEELGRNFPDCWFCKYAKPKKR